MQKNYRNFQKAKNAVTVRLTAIKKLKVKFTRLEQHQILLYNDFPRAVKDLSLKDDILKKLRESGHITVSPEGYITLTPSGKEIAERIYERHTLLTSWLEYLGVDSKTAADDACRIEHVISAESFDAIKKHIKR